MRRAAITFALAGLCTAGAFAGEEPQVHYATARPLEPVRVAPISAVEGTWKFDIGEWRDYTHHSLGESPQLQWYFDLGQRDLNGGTALGGACPDGDTNTGERIYFTNVSDGAFFKNLVSQNDMVFDGDAVNGAPAEYIVPSYGIQADDNFLIIITFFDESDPNACADTTGTFLGGIVLDFGFQLGDLDPSDGHQAFFYTEVFPFADGIVMPAPFDGAGTYQFQFANFVDPVTGDATPHPNAQPAYWGTSEWGGNQGRPGTSSEGSIVDVDADSFPDFVSECFTTFDDASPCMTVAEPSISIAATFDTDTCPCTADLTGDTCGTNTNDFFQFLALYQAQDPAADFSPGGGINTNDFFAYLAAYQSDLNNLDCPG